MTYNQKNQLFMKRLGISAIIKTKSNRRKSHYRVRFFVWYNNIIRTRTWER
jgi:hypothetical protein